MPSTIPERWSMLEGMPKPIAAISGVEQRLDDLVEPGEQLLGGGGRAGDLHSLEHVPARVDDAGKDLRPADIDAYDLLSVHLRRLR